MLAVKFLGFALLARVSLATPLSLTILHTNDHHSHLEANRVEIEASKIAGLSAQASSNAINVELGGYPRIVSGYGKLKIDAETAGRSVLKLHAGDAITGTAYYSMFKGEADAKMMSLVCFDAFSLGNHEFDDGDQALANFIDKLQTVNASCATPVLAANVVPAATSPLLGKLSKSVVLSVAGQQVGIVGIDVRNKTLRSSSPSAGTTLTDERTAAQAEIDMLLGQSIDKIVLVTHMGYDSDMSLMATLRGVDVVIGGDSHSLLGDNTTREVDFSPIHGEYATVMRNADGKMVCVVQAWEYNKAIGELEVDFDTSGDVLRCGGQPRFPYASQIQSGRRRSSQAFVINSSDTASVMSYLDSTGQFMLVEEDAHTAAELSSYQTQVEALKQETIAYAPNKICFDRWPGQGAGSCPIAETREQGGGACQLVAQGFLEVTKAADVAIQNGGGCRTDIAAGNFSHNDAYTMLPFSNTLVTLELTGAQIKAVLEDAADFGITDSSGAFPYAAGLRYDVNRNETKGDRITFIEVRPRLTGGWMPIDNTATYVVVTNSYIAGGRDSYTTFTEVSGSLRNTYIEYAEGFARYCKEVGTLVEPPREDFSTQGYIDAAGQVQGLGARSTTTTTTATELPGQETSSSSGMVIGSLPRILGAAVVLLGLLGA